MYDVTSEQSFKSLRNWIYSIKVSFFFNKQYLEKIKSISFEKETASAECLLTIIGNKIDLTKNDDNRVVKFKDGANLAKVIQNHLT